MSLQSRWTVFRIRTTHDIWSLAHPSGPWHVCPRPAVRGPNGLVILPDGSFAVQSIYGRNHLVMDRVSRPLPQRVIHKPGDYFTLLGKFSNSGNYSHWIHGWAPAVARRSTAFTRRREVPGAFSAAPVPAPETLYIPGLHDDQLIPFPGDSVWECSERLWFASLPPAGAEVREAVLWLREQLMASTDHRRGRARSPTLPFRRRQDMLAW